MQIVFYKPTRNYTKTNIFTEGPARTITLFDGDPADEVVLPPCVITPLPHEDVSPALASIAAAAALDDVALAGNGCGPAVDTIDGVSDVPIPLLNSKTAANEPGNRFSGASAATVPSPAAGAHSAKDDLLFCANTDAVTDSMAAATLRGVTMICGRMAAAVADELHDDRLAVDCGCVVLLAPVSISESQSLELSRSILKVCVSSTAGIVLESSLTKDRSWGTSKNQTN